MLRETHSFSPSHASARYHLASTTGSPLADSNLRGTSPASAGCPQASPKRFPGRHVPDPLAIIDGNQLSFSRDPSGVSQGACTWSSGYY